MLVGQLAGCARRQFVDETVRPLRIEPDHPVPQRLTVHAADLRRLLSRAAVEHRRDRKQSARLRRILHPLRNPPNIAARTVLRTTMARPMANDPPFATLNHFADDLGIPSE